MEKPDARSPLNKVLELAQWEWIERRQNRIELGRSGTCNTYIGLALGLVASGLNPLIGWALNGQA